MTDEEFAQRAADILYGIPHEFTGALSYMAYESGHAYGNHEILSHLQDLVDGLKDAIENYRKRIEGDTR